MGEQYAEQEAVHNQLLAPSIIGGRGALTTQSTPCQFYGPKGCKKLISRAKSSTASPWSIAPGEIVGLLGPNGAGKTTSFYMMVGLVKPDGGRVLLDDKDITRLPMYQRAQEGIGYLAQEPSAFRGPDRRAEHHAHFGNAAADQSRARGAAGRPARKPRYDIKARPSGRPLVRRRAAAHRDRAGAGDPARVYSAG